MPGFEPIVVLATRGSEFSRKPGGGSESPPIVPVDADLRQQLSGELRGIESLLTSDFASRTNGIPLAITVREEALAKTKRPYEFLSSTHLDPSATVGRGEMISQATSSSIRDLATAIQTRTSKADVFAISTIRSLRVWDPTVDAIRPSGSSSIADLLEEARSTGHPLRVELFPWLSPDSPWSSADTPLRDHLEEIGLPVQSVVGSPSRRALYLSVTDRATGTGFGQLYGVRSAVVAPSYSAPRSVDRQSFRTVASTLAAVITPPSDVQATVGVLDSGVAAGVLSPWVRRSWVYDVGSDADPVHGTFVAGLIVAARELNGGSAHFPRDSATIFDAQVLPRTSINENVLIDRITEVLNASGVDGPRVWNCSFNNQSHMDPVEYGTLAQELDLLASQHGVLFVQSAGNYLGSRTWPPNGSAGTTDALASPAEGVNSLTVGSLSHLGGMTPAGAVASYSRRGPSFGGQQKPEVTFWSGDTDSTGQLAGFGVRSVGVANTHEESVGTSFSTPIVSGIAANIWAELAIGGAVTTVTPALVKGLVIHSATLANMTIDDGHRTYYGAGVPRADSLALFDSPTTFTTIHEVDLRTGVNWEKRPFPIPACLFDGRGRIRAAVTLTLAYAPLIDAAFGDESVRTSVEVSFGSYERTGSGEKFKGRMGGSHDWESNLVERGKWAPVKSYRKVWSRGIHATADWSLKLRLTARDASIEPLAQKAYVIVTLEGLEEDLPVRVDGMRAITDLRYQNALAVDAGRIRLGNQT